jgi:hypothetical protein
MLFSGLSIINVSKLQRELDGLLDEIDEKFVNMSGEMEKEVESTKELLGGNGIVENYLILKNYYENTSLDIARYVSELQKDKDKPYFRFFITGTENVWIGIKDNVDDGSYKFQKTYEPGMSEEKFYYFKKPDVETEYDIFISPESYIKAGIPENVYLMFTAFGSGKLVKVPEEESIKNLKKEYNLYIPGS